MLSLQTCKDISLNVIYIILVIAKEPTLTVLLYNIDTYTILVCYSFGMIIHHMEPVYCFQYMCWFLRSNPNSGSLKEGTLPGWNNRAPQCAIR